MRSLEGPTFCSAFELAQKFRGAKLLIGRACRRCDRAWELGDCQKPNLVKPTEQILPHKEALRFPPFPQVGQDEIADIATHRLIKAVTAFSQGQVVGFAECD